MCIVALLFMIGVSVCVYAAEKAEATEQFMTHTVKKSESISLICIDYYGNYSDEMAAVITKENPDIKDINVIYAGQTIKLRNPDYKGEKAEPHVAALFEKNISATQGVITAVDGEVFLSQKANGGAKQKCNPNTIVYPGDVIITGAKGRVELIINRETVVRISENTKLSVEALRDAGKDAGKTKMGFSLGAVWAKMKKFRDKTSRFELELPTAIAGVHGTVYQASVAGDSSAEVKVYNGEVAVQNNPEMPGAKKKSGISEVSGPGEVAGPREVSMDEWVKIVRDMQRIRIDKKGKPMAVEPFKKNEDDSWEKWNMERDQRAAELFEENE
jgi:cytochrome c556